MKTLRKLFVVIIVTAAVFTLLGCGVAPAIQMGVGLAGSMAASSAKFAGQNGTDIKINQQVEEISIGNNIVKVNRGWANGNFSIVFSAFDKSGILIDRTFRTLPTEKYMEELKVLKTMSEKEKKQYVKNIFLAKSLDLGPVEETVAETKSEPPSISSSYIPTTGFAPRIR